MTLHLPERHLPTMYIGKNKTENYSRRIDETNRLVYQIDTLGNIKITSCRGHYEDED